MALGNFALDLHKFQNKTEKQIKNGLQLFAMELFKRVILSSPVDTGRFRANWGVNIGSPFTGKDNSAVDKSGPGAISKAQENVTRWDLKKTIFMCNNLPYSIALEYGHSQQAPAPYGIIRKSILAMGGKVATTVKGA